MKLEIALQTTRDIIRRKHLAHATEQNYCQWITRYSRFVVAKCEATDAPEQKMESFLTQLAKHLHAEALSVRSPLEVYA